MIRTLFALFATAMLATAAPALADPPPVEAYGRLPAVEFPVLSPDGDRFAFIADDHGVRRLYVATTDNKPLLVHDIGQIKAEAIDWAGEDLVLLRVSRTTHGGVVLVVDKAEMGTVFAFNLKTSAFVQVFADHPTVQPFVFGSFGEAQVDGRWYGYFGGVTMELDRGDTNDWHFANGEVRDGGTDERINIDLYKVDLETGDLTVAARGQDNSSSWLIGPQGEIVARALYSDTSGDWRVQSGAVGGTVLDTGQAAWDAPELVSFGRTADAVLIRKRTGEGDVTEEASLAGGAPKPAEGVGWDDEVMVGERSRLWEGVLHDGDQPTATFFDPAKEARVRAATAAFPGYRVKLASVSDDFKHLIVFTDGSDDAGTYWLVDIDKHAADPIGSAYPEVKADAVGPVRMVDWTAADGLALRGVLTLPPGRAAKDLPLVVMPHGGPEGRDYPGFNYWAQAFAARGYAVFQPNFRGSSGYGQRFRDAGFGEWGRKMQTDVSDGLAKLARDGVANPKRACIVGWSYGGYAALAGVTLQHGLYRCAVSMAGVSDPMGMLPDLGDRHGQRGRRYWKTFLGATSDFQHMRSISPQAHTNEADAPILLIHGDDDTVVPIKQTDDMEHALKIASKPVERLTLPHADHWLLEQDARTAMLKASVAFVEKYNPPDPAPAVAATAAQSAH